jgi:tetratricopeptide (TPR) repeat protein
VLCYGHKTLPCSTSVHLHNCAGHAFEGCNDTPEALTAYERALRANPQSITALTAISLLLRGKEEFVRAIDYIQMILQIDPKNGEAWASLGMQVPLVHSPFEPNVLTCPPPLRALLSYD